jgi:ribosome-associated protein
VPDDLRVNNWLVIPAAELHERFSRSSGPGGQSVNTTDSRVELSFDVEHSAVLPEWARARATERLAGRLADGVLTVVASEQRSQHANRQGARARLADLLRDAIARPPRPRIATSGACRPSAAGLRSSGPAATTTGTPTSAARSNPRSCRRPAPTRRRGVSRNAAPGPPVSRA